LAARLPRSTVTVIVRSVDRESYNREETPAPGVVMERTSFVARAEIVEVPHNEHGLTPGTVIDIRYDVVVRQPPGTMLRGKTLTPGETVTLIGLYGRGTSFTWQP
jgi:hypothetical protein